MLNLTIDLTAPGEESPLPYRKSQFPDGQQDITLELKTSQSLSYENNWLHSLVTIKSRLNSWAHLERIVCTVAALRAQKVKRIALYVPYILGARSDRKFENGGNRYLKDVLAPVINLQKFETVTCMDPHSYVLENVIDNLEIRHPNDFYNWAYKDICSKHAEVPVLVTPDAGAEKRVFGASQKVDHQGEIIICSKHRPLHGGYVKTKVPDSDTSKPHIIIDDICDGGATFIGIAKALKAKNASCPIYLVVTHGIFSKGFSEIDSFFEGIYCTNSYSDILDITILASATSTRSVGDLVKQFNVF